MKRLIYIINGNLATDEDVARLEVDCEKKIGERIRKGLQPTMELKITSFKGDVVCLETIGG